MLSCRLQRCQWHEDHHKSLDIDSHPNPGSQAKTAAKPASDGRRLVKDIRIRNHQVRLKRQVRHSSQRVDDRWPHRKIGHEMSVHHVHVGAVAEVVGI